MQAFIYITVCIEILLFVHFPFSEQIMPLLSKMAKIPIYSNILYSKLFTFFIIMVTCIGTRSKKDLELDPTKQIIFPLIFGFIMFFGSICFLFFKENEALVLVEQGVHLIRVVLCPGSYVLHGQFMVLQIALIDKPRSHGLVRTAVLIVVADSNQFAFFSP